jgi:hypothetical protein
MPPNVSVPGYVGDVLSYAGRKARVMAGSAKELVAQLGLYPDGAGGIVMGSRVPGSAGHAFNWFIENSRVVFWDAELGRIQNLTQFAQNQRFVKLSWVSTLESF